MRPELQTTENNLSEALKRFHELPAQSQDLILPGNRAEKETGKKRAAVGCMIKPQSMRSEA